MALDAAQQKQTQSNRPERVVNQLKSVLWMVCGMGVVALASLYFVGALESESARFRRLVEGGRAALRQEKFYQASLDLRQAVRIKKDNAEAYLLLARSLMWIRYFRDAVGAYEESVRLDPANADALTELVAALLNFGHLEKAERYALMLEKLRPTTRAFALSCVTCICMAASWIGPSPKPFG